MKYPVICVDEGNLVRFIDNKNPIKLSSYKPFRYEFPKNTDLSLHILNIHNAFGSLHPSFDDVVCDFTIRIQTITKPSLPHYPIYLEQSGLEIDTQLAKLLSALPKPYKRKGFQFEFVLSHNASSRRFIDIIKKYDSSKATIVKQTAFTLVSQLKNQDFSHEFVQNEGVETLLCLLEAGTGNTIAYTINALGATLQKNENALPPLLAYNGVMKLLRVLELSNISALRRAMEVLHFVCHSDNTREVFFDAAEKEENRGFIAIFKQLEAQDLHTRLATLQIVNQLLAEAPTTSQKDSLCQLIKQKNIVMVLQKSLCVALPEMILALKNFEVAFGSTLINPKEDSGSQGPGNDLKNRISELEREIETLKDSKEENRSNTESTEPTNADSLFLEMENDIGALSFVDIDFAEEFDFGVEDESSCTEEVSTGPGRAVSTSSSRLSTLVASKSNPMGFEPSDALELEMEVLRSECADVKNEFEICKAKLAAFELLGSFEDVRNLKEENILFKAKIVSLGESVETLLKAKSERTVNPAVAFHLSGTDRLRDSTIATPISTPKITPPASIDTATAAKEENLSATIFALQEELDDLQTRKYEVDMDNYDLELNVTRLEKETAQIEEKNEKLQKVTSALEQKRSRLLEECEISRNTLTKIKEVTERQKKEKIDSERKISILHDLPPEERLKEMRELITCLMEEKSGFSTQIEALEEEVVARLRRSF